MSESLAGGVHHNILTEGHQLLPHNDTVLISAQGVTASQFTDLHSIVLHWVWRKCDTLLFFYYMLWFSQISWDIVWSTFLNNIHLCVFVYCHGTHNWTGEGRVGYISWDERQDKQDEDPKGSKDTGKTQCHTCDTDVFSHNHQATTFKISQYQLSPVSNCQPLPAEDRRSQQQRGLWMLRYAQNIRYLLEI